MLEQQWEVSSQEGLCLIIFKSKVRECQVLQPFTGGTLQDLPYISSALEGRTVGDCLLL